MCVFHCFASKFKVAHPQNRNHISIYCGGRAIKVHTPFLSRILHKTQTRTCSVVVKKGKQSLQSVKPFLHSTSLLVAGSLKKF